MTPQEAADIAVACTATGQSGLPLWQYLPGMQVLYADGLIEGTRLQGAGMQLSPDSAALVHQSLEYAEDAHGPVRRISNLRPDFTDALTVQALWLLVRRAYHAARVNLTLIERCDGTVCLRVTGLHTLTAYDAEGPAYAVFTRALQKAPTQ